MPPIAEAFARFVVAIGLDAAGLIVWDVGRRSPGRLAADFAAAVRSGRGARAAARTLIGLLFLHAGAVIALPAIPASAAFVIEAGLLFAALAVEALAGPVLRRRRPSA